ncbi:MAG: tripartite tricarboxylate transporter TctB family protein [Burkholderiales bacterium]|nr:tripartite tricarboxylate transporter TctB family protein [Burkholderiales bacterium]
MEPGISQRSAELVVAALTLALGLTVVIASYRLGSGWASDGPQAGYFPFYTGLLICIGSVANIVMALLRAGREGRVLFVSWVSLQRVSTVLIPAALFVGAIHLVGIYVSALFYIASFMILLGRYPVWKSVSVGLGVSVVLFFMFEVWFKVLLPKGAYNILSYFGH